MSYVSKVTSAGQITLPKKIREDLGFDKGSYLVVDELGQAVILRKLEAHKDVLEAIRRKVRKTGLTRERVEEIVEEERWRIWKETHEEGIP